MKRFELKKFGARPASRTPSLSEKLIARADVEAELLAGSTRMIVASILVVAFFLRQSASMTNRLHRGWRGDSHLRDKKQNKTKSISLSKTDAGRSLGSKFRLQQPSPAAPVGKIHDSGRHSPGLPYFAAQKQSAVQAAFTQHHDACVKR